VASAPSPEHLERYADLLVNFALGGGAGIARDDVVLVTAPEPAKPLYSSLCEAVWRAGGHVIDDYRPADDSEHNLTARFFEIAADEQLDFFPTSYRRGLLDQCDHQVAVRCDRDPRALDTVDAAKLMRRQRSYKPLVQWQQEKESAGRFSWTVALYGTEAMAAEAEMSIDDYWEQIIAACFLDDHDPKRRWREVVDQMTGHIQALNALPIDRLHVEGQDADLWITLGERRRWIGGGGRNIPSFEIFTSPDWRGTEGEIAFSEPLYVFGKLIRGARLKFHDGVVVEARATENESLLQEMVASEGGDRVGEFSLTDARLSPITRFMADTLFDENVGGPFGNTHIAIGNSLHTCYDGDPETLGESDWRALGFNDSVIHTDIVSTTDRTVTAVLTDGTKHVIYTGGQFTDELPVTSHRGA
jgi:aminopeptidase